MNVSSPQVTSITLGVNFTFIVSLTDSYCAVSAAVIVSIASPMFPGFIVITLLLWVCGIILQVIVKKHRQLYELMMNMLVKARN